MLQGAGCEESGLSSNAVPAGLGAFFVLKPLLISNVVLSASPRSKKSPRPLLPDFLVWGCCSTLRQSLEFLGCPLRCLINSGDYDTETVKDLLLPAQCPQLRHLPPHQFLFNFISTLIPPWRPVTAAISPVLLGLLLRDLDDGNGNAVELHNATSSQYLETQHKRGRSRGITYAQAL